VPGSGGTRDICTTAVAAPEFGGTSQGVVPNGTTALQTAIWLAQYSPADWSSAGSGSFGGGPIAAQLMIGNLGTGQLDVPPRLSEGKTICITVNKGPVTQGGAVFSSHQPGAQTSASFTAKNIALGTAAVAGAGLLGAFLYARHKRTTTKAVLKTAWKKTGGKIHVPHHLHLPHMPHFGKKR
jgi:hypothetical protein